MSEFYHGDVLERLPPAIPLSFLPCRDFVVHCTVQFHILLAGSFHPSAAALVDVLTRSARSSSGGLSLGELANAIGARGDAGLRYTSELVARLRNAHQIEQVPNMQCHFRALDTGESSLKPNTEVVTHSLFFLPRISKLIWPFNIKNGLAKAKVRWWKPPDQKALYALDSLSEAIERECPAFVKDRRNLFPKWERTFSIEDLEHNRLLLREPELIEAKVINRSISKDLVFHRCYFNTNSSNAAWVRVFWSDEPVPETAYSAYFQAAIASQPGFLDSMRAASKVLRP